MQTKTLRQACAPPPPRDPLRPFLKPKPSPIAEAEARVLLRRRKKS